MKFRPKLSDSFKTFLLHEDCDGAEHEMEVTVYVDDWEDFNWATVELQGWDITALMNDDERQQIDSAMREHYATQCDWAEAAREDYGDWLYEQRKDYAAESRGE